MERFDTYLHNDLDFKVFDRTYYTENALDKLYNELSNILNINDYVIKEVKENF